MTQEGSGNLRHVAHVLRDVMCRHVEKAGLQPPSEALADLGKGSAPSSACARAPQWSSGSSALRRKRRKKMRARLSSRRTNPMASARTISARTPGSEVRSTRDSAARQHPGIQRPTCRRRDRPQVAGPGVLPWPQQALTRHTRRDPRERRRHRRANVECLGTQDAPQKSSSKPRACLRRSTGTRSSSSGRQTAPTITWTCGDC